MVIPRLDLTGHPSDDSDSSSHVSVVPSQGALPKATMYIQHWMSLSLTCAVVTVLSSALSAREKSFSFVHPLTRAHMLSFPIRIRRNSRMCCHVYLAMLIHFRLYTLQKQSQSKHLCVRVICVYAVTYCRHTLMLLMFGSLPLLKSCGGR